MLNAKVRPGGIAMHPNVSGILCGACDNPAVKEGWCGRCYPLYGDVAWRNVGKKPKKAGAK